MGFLDWRRFPAAEVKEEQYTVCQIAFEECVSQFAEKSTVQRLIIDPGATPHVFNKKSMFEDSLVVAPKNSKTGLSFFCAHWRW